MILSFEQAAAILNSGGVILAANDMHAAFGGVDCIVRDIRDLKHYEEGNQTAFGPAVVRYATHDHYTEREHARQLDAMPSMGRALATRIRDEKKWTL